VIRRRYGLHAVIAGAAALALVAVSSGPAVADSTRDRQWYLSTLDVAKAHQLSEGAGVTVALIDTGVDAKHRDLAGAILSGEDLSDPHAGDGTGRNDTDGHGTALAGIIAGRGHGNGAGILGIAPKAKILPIHAIDNFFESTSVLVTAIDYAIAHHAGVINMSFTGGRDSYLEDAIRKAQAADIVVVAGAGNHATAAAGLYPGAYPEVLTVGAIGENGKIASLSVTGPQVDLVAPGVDIASTGINASGYALTSGTSDSTAIVSGAAALIRAKYPDLSAAEVVHRLTATATDAGPKGRDDTYGYGRLNLVKALTADVPVAVASSAPSHATAEPASVSTIGSHRNRVIAAVAIAALVILLICLAFVFVVVRRRR
jgi:type VII secretion-associated serine protease mycosin